MHYMVVEHYRNGDAEAVYGRFRERGRMAPPGVEYVTSWVTEDLSRCYQVMACDERSLLDEWIEQWDDLVEFEVIPVITSEDAARRAL